MKKTMNWEYYEGNLICEHLDNDGEQQPFDLNKVFSDIEDFNEVQITIIVYGLKQKLADATARSKDMKLTAYERKAVMEETYNRIVDGKWLADREVGDRISVKKIAKKAEDMELSDETRAALKELGILK